MRNVAGGESRTGAELVRQERFSMRSVFTGKGKIEERQIEESGAVKRKRDDRDKLNRRSTVETEDGGDDEAVEFLRM